MTTFLLKNLLLLCLKYDLIKTCTFFVYVLYSLLFEVRKIYINACNIKTQIFPELKFNLKGHRRSHKALLSKLFLVHSFVKQFYENFYALYINIMKTHFFLKMKYIAWYYRRNFPCQSLKIFSFRDSIFFMLGLSSIVN